MLTSLGIVRDHLRALLKPFNTIVLCCTIGFMGFPQLGPHDAERGQSLGQLYASSLPFFQCGRRNEPVGIFKLRSKCVTKLHGIDFISFVSIVMFWLFLPYKNVSRKCQEKNVVILMVINWVWDFPREQHADHPPPSPHPPLKNGQIGLYPKRFVIF